MADADEPEGRDPVRLGRRGDRALRRVARAGEQLLVHEASRAARSALKVVE